LPSSCASFFSPLSLHDALPILLIFLAVVLLGLVIPRSWDPERRTALLGMLVLLVSLWAMVSQLLFLWDVSLPAQALAFLRGSRRSEEHTSELQSRENLVCRLLL